MRLGDYPTPVQRLEDRLWVKRDDLTNREYGGNKVRKLELVLTRAASLGVRRIVTVGAAGSHHALATAHFSRALGIEVEAVLVPQPRTDHVAENLRATSSLARVFPAASFAHAATIVVDRVACGAHYVPPGGSRRFTTTAYADAARELLVQVERGEIPMPEAVVVPVGSGGTAAGLAAGFAHAGASVRVAGVLVAAPRGWVIRRTRKLAAGCLDDIAPASSSSASRLRLDIDDRYLGAGYGFPTPEGVRAVAEGHRHGLSLDTTYTGKAFAAALDLAGRPESGPLVFWNTLSSASLSPFLANAPREEELAVDVRALLQNVRG